MALDQDRIYELLPAIYRLRDAEAGGGALRDLMGVIAEQAEAMEEDIAALYRNWFIETCDPWVVPYIADLLDVRLTHDVAANRALPQRAYVANTLAYRRGKGTLPVIEEVVRDTTGWITAAAEHMLDLSVTANMNHVRPSYPGTLDLRDAARLGLLDGAFDPGPRTAEMRRIADGGGRYNVPNIGLFIWRAEAFPLGQVQARGTDGGGAGRYHLDPLRRDIPLCNTPESEAAIDSLTGEAHTPGLLRPLQLFLELEARRQAIADGLPAPTPQFFSEEPPFEIWIAENPGDPLSLVPAEEVMICHLGEMPGDPTEWQRPPALASYTPSDSGGPVDLPIRVGIDPERGRAALPTGQTVDDLRVTHATLSMGDIGGGPYDRSESLAEALGERGVDWQALVTTRETADGQQVFNTLQGAIAAWHALAAGQVGLICVGDNAPFVEDLSGANRIEIPEGSLLVIAAADWPALPVPNGAPGETARNVGTYDPSGLRPALVGEVAAIGTAPANSDLPGGLVIDGLIVDGEIDVLNAAGEGLGTLRLAHTTQAPAHEIRIGTENEALVLDICRARSGGILAADDIQRLGVTESVIAGDPAIQLRDGEVLLERATLLGPVTVERIHASNTIFTQTALARRSQTGCVRFSFVPQGSTLPRRYRCQPDMALDGAAPAEVPSILAAMVPSFQSLEPAHYAYALLGPRAPVEILEGANDGAAMGAMGFLMRPQRWANARVALDEYLRFGLEAGLIEVT